MQQPSTETLPYGEDVTESLPYGGDVQLAMAAGDRDAIRAIFNSRIVAEGGIPAQVPEAEGIVEVSSTETPSNQYNTERTSQNSVCLGLLPLVPLLFFIIFIIAFFGTEARIHPTEARIHPTYIRHHQQKEDPSWGYLLGFFIIVLAVIAESGSLTLLGFAVIVTFAAVLNKSVFLGFFACLLLFSSCILAFHNHFNDEEQVEENDEQVIENRANVALEQGTKKVIFKVHEHAQDHQAVVVAEFCGASKCSSHANSHCCALDEEVEECAICLEAFEDDEELTAAACGHYYHTKCFKQWILQDGHADRFASSGEMRCPVCRFEVMEGVGAATPARIRHMRPEQRRLQQEKATQQQQQRQLPPARRVSRRISNFQPMESIAEQFEDIDLEEGQPEAQISTAPAPSESLWARLRATFRARSPHSSRDADGVEVRAIFLLTDPQSAVEHL